MRGPRTGLAASDRCSRIRLSAHHPSRLYVRASARFELDRWIPSGSQRLCPAHTCGQDQPRFRRPCSCSFRIDSEVKALETEPMRNRISAVTGRPAARSAFPTPPANAISSRVTMAIPAPGVLVSTRTLTISALRSSIVRGEGSFYSAAQSTAVATTSRRGDRMTKSIRTTAYQKRIKHSPAPLGRRLSITDSNTYRPRHLYWRQRSKPITYYRLPLAPRTLTPIQNP